MDEKWHEKNLRKAEDRDVVANSFRKIANELDELERWYVDHDADPMLVSGEEWPFDRSLGDTAANIRASAELIDQTNMLLRLNPITLTIPTAEFQELLTLLDQEPKVLPRLRAFLDDEG